MEVNEAAIASSIKICKNVKNEMNGTIEKIVGIVEKAGGQWQDAKYDDIKASIFCAIQELDKPIGELDICTNRLSELLKILQQLEE